MISWDTAPIQVRLDTALTDGSMIAERLNGTGLVSARLDGETLVARPTRQPPVAGLPAYYAGRPEFRGRLVRPDDGRIQIEGYIEQSHLPHLFNAAAGALAVLTALFGVVTAFSGDMAGLIAIVVGAVIGGGVVVTTRLLRLLSSEDRKTISSALFDIADDPNPSGVSR